MFLHERGEMDIILSESSISIFCNESVKFLVHLLILNLKKAGPGPAELVLRMNAGSALKYVELRM